MIWANQFIGLGLLLKRRDDPFSLNISRGSEIFTQGSSNPNLPMSMEQLTAAFFNFYGNFYWKMPKPGSLSLKILLFCQRKWTKCYSPWNLLLFLLNGERTSSERTVSALWANGMRTLNGIRWTLMNHERWANAERNWFAKWTVDDMWTLGERKMNDLSECLGIIHTLYFVGNQEKVANKLNIQCCYRESEQKNPILSNILQIFIQFYVIHNIYVWE